MRLLTLLASGLFATSTIAQETVTVTTGATNSQQTFYSLQNGVIASAPMAEWDLAFEITGFSSSILVNTAKGLTVFETSVVPTDWATINAPDEANWTPIHNSEIDWSAGALTNGNNLDQPDGFNVGWGTYSIITHTIAGTKVYVIADGQGGYRKLRINSLASGSFSFTYADLDGSNEHTGTLIKPNYTGKNFGYWNMTTHTAMDREPATATWDLVFTKYIGFVPTAYALAGVLQNKGITALQVDGVPTAQADAWSAEYSADINIIGADWKSFNMTTFAYEYVQDRTYFVKDQQGNIWKLIFIGYGGSANGDMTFTKELVSATSVEENGTRAGVAIFPNPVRDGRVQFVLDAPAGPIEMEVLDMNGRIVSVDRFPGLGDLQVRTMDVSDLRAGMYIVRMLGAGISTSTRLVVE